MLDNLQKKTLSDRVADGGIDRNKFRLMEGKRLCGAIDLWLRAHMQANNINRFSAADAQDYRTLVYGIAEHIDAINRDSPSFDTAVKALVKPVIKPGTGPAKGRFGTVPASIVDQVVGGGTQITRQAVVQACNVMAAKFGQDGVKILKGDVNLAELKILKMGNKRIVASTKVGEAYVFDKIVNKNDV